MLYLLHVVIALLLAHQPQAISPITPDVMLPGHETHDSAVWHTGRVSGTRIL